MQRRPVNSSRISGIGWEAAEEEDGTGTLEVAFRSGHIYQYEGVTEHDYRELLGASSVGRHFEGIIDKYQHRRLK